MYNVSSAYQLAIENQPTQEHRITGTVGSFSFSDENIVEGSFQITNQCTNTNEIVFGSCFIGQLECEFTGLDNSISFGEWIGLKIVPTFHFDLGNNNEENIPLGEYTIAEADHTEWGVKVTAYDNMSKLDAEIQDDNMAYLLGLKTDNLYAFAHYACSQVGAFLGMTKAEFDELPYNNNKGHRCEYWLHEVYNLGNYKPDNKRFDKCGDVEINGIQYQVKFENASLTNVNTLHNAQKSARAKR